DGFQVVVTRHVIGADVSKTRELVLKSIYQPGHNVTLVGSGGAPDMTAVTEAMDRVKDSMLPPEARATAPVTYDTANGKRTIDHIRQELRQAGWGGGSAQDAVATYTRLADAAAGH